jgi:two-component system sensor histidine kinase KdpD
VLGELTTGSRKVVDGLRAVALSTVLVAAGALAAWLLEVRLGLSDASIIFLAAVIGSAVWWGRVASIYTAFASLLTYNFFFVEPIHTFRIARPSDLLELLVFFGVAIITSSLAGRARAEAEASEQRARQTQALLALSQQLASASGVDGVARAVAGPVAQIIGAETAVLMPEPGGPLALKAASPAVQVLPPAMLDSAASAWASGNNIQHTDNDGWLFLRLTAGQSALGLLGVHFGPSAQPGEETLRLLPALAGQAAVALERARLSQGMAEARMLAETERLRTALLSSVSHDLRTPLASILGAVTSLERYREIHDEATQTELLETIREEAERLDRFVGNLLSMTRLESGALIPNVEWVDLQDLIGSALARLAPPLTARQVIVRVDPGLPLLQLDFVLMEQVLVNLLENAMKYTAPGQTIRISAFRDGDWVAIEVGNEGVGLAPEDLDHIFEKFYRVQGSDRQRAGTGLGLSICRGIVEALGGRISARLPQHGPGAVFRIELPVVEPPALEAEAEGANV